MMSFSYRSYIIQHIHGRRQEGWGGCSPPLKKKKRGERKTEWEKKVKRGIKRDRKLNQSFQEHVVIGLWQPPDSPQTSDVMVSAFPASRQPPFRKILPTPVDPYIVNLSFLTTLPCEYRLWFNYTAMTNLHYIIIKILWRPSILKRSPNLG